MSRHRIPVSAVLITLDAERHLDAVLTSLGSCSEILILDSGSKDRTREIADRHQASWHEHRFDGYGSQKRRAVSLASNDWVFAVDADEVLDERAGRALASMAWSTQDSRDCWRILRRPFVGEREVRHGHWVPDRIVRLFNRRAHGFSGHPVHPTVEATGTVHELPGSFLHYCYVDMADIFRVDYHRLKAAEYRARGRRCGAPVLLLRAGLVFFRSYLLRRGFLDGRLGVVVAMAGALNAVLGLAMASEAEVE